MIPAYERDGIRLYVGDCREVVPALPEPVSAVVTDPPYGLGFMGKDWDHEVPGEAFWRVFSDAMLPGAHLLSFGGTRTYHRIAVAIEDAGFEIRDTLMWLYGSGFPKSLDVSKAIDKTRRRDYVLAAIDLGLNIPGNSLHDWTMAEHSPSDAWWEKFKAHLSEDDWQRIERRVIGHGHRKNDRDAVSIKLGRVSDDYDITAPATPEAEQWQGWGTSLKPGYEPVLWAQKPRTYDRERDIIVGNLMRLEAQLWSLLPANIAVETFKLSPREYDAACAFAQWSAEEQRNTLADLCDPTDTSQFVSVMTTCLNTVMSWSNTLDALWSGMSTSTTATESGPTIDLKTLKSLLSPLTPRTMLQAAIEAPGSTLSVLPAARYFLAVEKSMSATLELSALDRATAEGHIGRRDETGLAPEYEPIILARKPLTGTVAQNVLEHGTGALNIDACRLRLADTPRYGKRGNGAVGSGGVYEGGYNPENYSGPDHPHPESARHDARGRWPANVILDEHAAALLDEQSGERKVGGSVRADMPSRSGYDGGWNRTNSQTYGDTGGASRFFYVAKASRAERNRGLPEGSVCSHPTVKPLALMRWLLTLVTPPGGIVVDPFVGSGSTLVACAQLGIPAYGIDMNEEYIEIAARRIDHALNERAREEAKPRQLMIAD